MVARAETEVEGTAVVRGGIKAGKEQVRGDGQEQEVSGWLFLTIRLNLNLHQL